MPTRPRRIGPPRKHHQPTSARGRGYGLAWAKASADFLKQEAAKEGKPKASCRIRSHRCLGDASMVDHIIPHKGDPILFWEKRNWQPACIPCNKWKAATSEGAFGNPQRKVAS